MKKENINFTQFNNLSNKLYNLLEDNKYKGIVCPLYGGIYIGDFLRRKFNIPIHFLRIESYTHYTQDYIKVHSIPFLESGHYLFVDDIYDTGKTVNWVVKNYPQCTFDTAFLVSKIPHQSINCFKYVKADVWISFWWEN